MYNSITLNKPIITMYRETVYQIDLQLGKGLITGENGNQIMFLLSSVIGVAVKEEDKVVL